MRYLRFVLLILMLSTVHVDLISQTDNTIGLILNDERSYNGYTLLTPSNSVNTYLIDNCGKVVNHWTSEYRPGLSAYITEQGTLLRSGRVAGQFNAGGSGGLIQEFNWEGDLIWEFRFSDDKYGSHHDIEPLPNGNVLILAWEKLSYTEALFLGRDVNLLTDEGIWTEAVFEVRSTGPTTYDIVWEWHLKDHIVQDVDLSATTAGVVAEHPELLDINYEGNFEDVDLLHANSIDYNVDLDQILINFRNYNEFIIIDHSTTTLEASSSTGGTSGKGGNILYRYGNPQTYDRGSEGDRRFYLQHGARWVDTGDAYKGEVVVFNNGVGRPQGAFSSIEIVKTTWNGSEYTLDEGQAFGPPNFSFVYVGTPVSDFFSARLSNAVVLPNDNVLICEGRSGNLFEINPEKKIVWEYVNPLLSDIVLEQGSEDPLSDLFSVDRYAMDYAGFEGRDLTAGNPIELNSDYDCDITLEPVSTVDIELQDVYLAQNPIANTLYLENDKSRSLQIEIVDLMGRSIGNYQSAENWIDIELDLVSGCYLVKISDLENRKFKTLKFIKS